MFLFASRETDYVAWKPGERAPPQPLRFFCALSLVAQPLWTLLDVPGLLTFSEVSRPPASRDLNTPHGRTVTMCARLKGGAPSVPRDWFCRVCQRGGCGPARLDFFRCGCKYRLVIRLRKVPSVSVKVWNGSLSRNLKGPHTKTSSSPKKEPDGRALFN